MFNWSFGFISKIASNDNLRNAAFVVATLNLLVQIFFSMAFGDKSIPKLGGKR